MTLAKIKEFYFEKGKYIVLAAITALLFFANFWDPLWIVAASVCGLFYATCTITELFCFVMYFELFSTWDLFYVANVLTAFVCLTVRYIIHVVKKEKKIFVLPLAITAFIVLLFGCVHYHVNLDGFSKGGVLVGILFLMYYVFVYHKEIDLNKCYKFLTIGMIVSLVLGLISLLFSNPLQSIFYVDSHSYKRLQLYAFHTNFLAMLCLFNIAYYIYKIVNGKEKVVINVLAILLSTIIGVLTLSKAFLLLFAAMVCYFLIWLVLKYKKQSWKFVIPIIVAACLFVAIFHEFVFDIVKRFLAYDTGSLISQLTTGRTTIWKTYFEYSTSSVLKILFGVGLFTKDLISVGPHSVLLFLFYRVGVFGMVAFGVLVWSYFKSSTTKVKITFKNMLPVLLWIVVALEEMVFSERFAFFLVFAIILLVFDNKENKRVEGDVDKN